MPSRLDRAAADGSASARGALRGVPLTSLAEALRTLERARYQRSGELDGPALDAALSSAAGAMRRLWIAELWPFRPLGTRTGATHVGAALAPR